MNNKGIILPEYNENLFVNRDEIGKVTYRAQHLAAGHAVPERTVIFMGERGTGKTWLLKHLQTVLDRMSGVTPCGLDLMAYEDWNPLIAVTDMLQQLAKTLNFKLQTDEPSKMSRRFLAQVTEQLDDQVIVLLVDHVYEADWDLLDALEEYVLGPLAVEPQTLIVLAGRGRPYPFTTPELRFDAVYVDLKPFDLPKTRKQLKRQRKRAVSRAQKIYDIGKGNPLATYLLAEYEDPGEALDQVIHEMLKNIEDLSRRQRVREYLEALCVLQVFDEARIPAMLAAYHDDPQYRQWTHAQARQVREALVETGFAHWDSDESAYALDKPVRQLVEQYMRNNKPSIWERLQCAAADLYQGWAQQYERTQERWQEKYQYHHQQLQHRGADCPPVMALS
jgi:energy-coupling factor transporter ATP-binding protein EcfA2